jgi:hypothetical protein
MVPMDKNKPRHPRLRVFFVTAFFTFMIFMMGMGFLIADYNSRKMAFGDGSLRIDIYAEKNSVTVNILGREQRLEIPEQAGRWAGRVWNLLPPAVRAAVWIFQGECDAVSEILE